MANEAFLNPDEPDAEGDPEVPAAPWSGPLIQTFPQPEGQSDHPSSSYPEYSQSPVDLSYSPEITVVDQAHEVNWEAEYMDEEHSGETSSGWPHDENHASEQQDFHDETYADEYDAAYPGYENYYPGEPIMDPESEGLRSKLRPWHAVAAVAVLAAASIGWSFLHRAGVDGSREIATIEAPQGPMKVKPTIEPEPDAPTAGAAAVLDRNEPESVRKVVKNLEQAVDPSVTPRQIDSAAPDATPPAEIPGTVKLGAGRVDAPHEPPPAARLPQPRKVQSVAVPATPVTQPARLATAAPAQQTAPPAAKPASGATFSAQFATVNSETEARSLLKTLTGKYGGSLGGGKFTFKPVKTGDKTVYRVRVGGISREVAEALCAKAKTGGDACAPVGN